MKQVAAAAVLALALTGCGGGGDEASTSAGGDCDEAFQTASEVSDFQDTQEDLHPAFSACADYEEWAAASERYPTVLDGADPRTYASNQCQFTPALASTPVCTTLP